ncbi:hypothetical protein JOQ06_004424 [Pogonophryne albipinna]|nr:hypothetical protein JOQ06_004424 [Pogonophryne albipinna]
MIAKAGSETADHTTDTPLPARISQGPTGADNEASPFSVIDPAIWIETDKEAEEKRRNSESTADVELFASGKVCEMETPLTLCCDVGLSQEMKHTERLATKAAVTGNPAPAEVHVGQPILLLQGSDSLASDVNEEKFEMKKQFDMVLRELNLYFEISLGDLASESRASSPEQVIDITEALKDDTSICKEEHLRSPEGGSYRDTSSDDADEAGSLEMCGGDAVVSRPSGPWDGEQEVPLGSHLGQETSMRPAEKQKDTREMEQKKIMWSPSFGCQPLVDQLSHRQPEQYKRLEPLRTCSRPLRIGLSKRAKTKNLHRPHPYK